MSIILFWQLYIAIAFSNFVSLMYLQLADKDGKYMKIMNREIYDYMDLIPEWMVIIASFISSLLWPVALFKKFSRTDEEKELINKIEVNEELNKLNDKARQVKILFLILELVVIYITNLLY